MTVNESDIAAAAAAWRLAQEDMDSAQWQRFAAWLEADPRHGDAMARLDAAEALLPLAMPPAPAAAVAAESLAAVRWRRWAGGATALAAALALFMLMPQQPDSVSVAWATKGGETRDIALADGSRLVMNGDTRLAAEAPRRVRVDGGEALFTVAHTSGGARFTVVAGDVTITDVGTRFTVTRETDQVRVAVAEGAVAVRRGNQEMVLTAGNTLRLTKAGPAERGRAPEATVGSWQSLRPSFANAPLDEVVATIGRRIGVRIGLDQTLRKRLFTGNVNLTGSPERDVRHLALLMDANAKRVGEDWELVANKAAR